MQCRGIRRNFEVGEQRFFSLWDKLCYLGSRRTCSESLKILVISGVSFYCILYRNRFNYVACRLSHKACKWKGKDRRCTRVYTRKELPKPCYEHNMCSQTWFHCYVWLWLYDIVMFMHACAWWTFQLSIANQDAGSKPHAITVSYTHLTLPTIYSV